MDLTQTLRIIKYLNTQQIKPKNSSDIINQSTKGILQINQQEFNEFSSRTFVFIIQSTLDLLN